MTGNDRQSPLVAASAAHAKWAAGRARFVDGSWSLDPAAPPRNGPPLPGAVRFDLDAVKDTSSPLPHMAPPDDVLLEWARLAGLTPGEAIIVYDDAGLFSAPRVWWTFRHAGWSDVQVLDGGRPSWIDAGFPLDGAGADTAPVAGGPKPSGIDPVSRFGVAGVATVITAVRNGGARIIDARPAGRFRGEVAEPRVGLRSGAMPGALNLPFASLIGPDGRLKKAADLDAIFEEIGVGRDADVIATCGSGVTAAVIVLALEATGRTRHRLYDGSWAEWGLPDDAGERPTSSKVTHDLG